MLENWQEKEVVYTGKTNKIISLYDYIFYREPYIIELVLNKKKN